MRDREKVMRGMHSKESAQKIIEAMRIHYNYCREHSQLGKTPAEQAGIKLDLQHNKIECLMMIAARVILISIRSVPLIKPHARGR